MSFDELYTSALGMWPDSIDISDGQVTEEGVFFENLSQIWNGIEIVAKEKGEWYDLMTWTIFSNFHCEAKSNYLSGHYYINKGNLSSSSIRADFIKNLNVIGYEDMLKAFFDRSKKA